MTADAWRVGFAGKAEKPESPARPLDPLGAITGLGLTTHATFSLVQIDESLTTPQSDKMAFQSMMSGSECSTSANPLSQLLKQQQTDRSLHQGPSLQPSGQLPGTLRTHSPMQNGGQEVEQFYAGGQGGSGGMVKGGEFPGMVGLRREIEAVGRQHTPGQGKHNLGSSTLL